MKHPIKVKTEETRDKPIKATKIAKFLNARLIGDDIALTGVCSLLDLRDGCLSFVKKNKSIENPETRACLIVSRNKNIDKKSRNSYIKVANPRLAFAKATEQFFAKKRKISIAQSVKIGQGVKIAESVAIGENCIIGHNVSIGENTIINHNVVIAENTVIGKNCFIKSGSIIGEDGFGFDFEKDGTPIRIPHLGRVLIHDNVEVGAQTTIARGTIHDTVIHENVKIDDHVFIAHNCEIGKNTMITAFAQISGSVIIGKNCWLAPNCSIIQKIKIGDNVKIGIGAVVTSDIGDNITIMCLESLPIFKLSRFKKRIKYGD